MRIAILSDLHLGYERFREDAFRQAKEALDKACSMADAVIIPGDIFDTRFPKPDVLAEAINLFREASSRKFGARIVEFRGRNKIYTEKPLLAIPGTHERRTDDIEDPVDLLSLTALVADIGMGVAVLQKGDEIVAVTGIAGVAEERFKESLEKYAKGQVAGAFNILMFHQSLYELLPFSDTFMRMEDLPKGFDLYVDGHIHNRVEGSVHGRPLLIPGSTVLTQLKDSETERKGFFIYDTLDRSYEFIEIDSRNFEILRIDADSVSEGAFMGHVEGMVRGIISRKGPGAIIRMEIKGDVRRIKRLETELQAVVKRFRGEAFIEVARKGLAGVAGRETGIKVSGVEGLSVKDMGMGILIAELKKGGYDFATDPASLFEMLSSGEKKEKVIDRAVKELLG